MRLDKLLSNSTAFTRSQAKIYIKKGKVSVNGDVITNPAQHINDEATVKYMGVSVKTPEQRYLMLNKPVGVVCANKDEQHTTIFDSLFVPRIDSLHVAGRLDLDTTGLVIVTDDGQWLHRITSPKHEHAKVYRVDLAFAVTDKQLRILAEGVQLKNEKQRSLPAEIEVLTDNTVRMSIREGKYHQVKRMWAAVENHVVTLHREQIAHIKLDDELAEGQWRELTETEINSI